MTLNIVRHVKLGGLKGGEFAPKKPTKKGASAGRDRVEDLVQAHVAGDQVLDDADLLRVAGADFYDEVVNAAGDGVTVEV